MPYTFKGLRFPSFYVRDYSKAVDFYTTVLGPPQTNEKSITGWFIGDSWLTLFPAGFEGHGEDANPRNAEFAIEVGAPEEVDRLYAAMLAAGAKPCMAPEDTEMYVPMRFCCVDDPVGIRVDAYCLLPEK